MDNFKIQAQNIPSQENHLNLNISNQIQDNQHREVNSAEASERRSLRSP